MPGENEVVPSRSVNQTTNGQVNNTITRKQNAIQLAHLLLCGTSGWAVNRTAYDPIATVAFTFLLGHSLLGNFKLTMKNKNKMYIVKFCNYSVFLSIILPLPLINTQIYYNYGYYDMNTYSHAASSLFPIVFNALYKKWDVNSQTDSKTAMVKLVNLSNICSLSYIGILKENYWAIGLSWVSVFQALTLDFLEEGHSASEEHFILIALSFFNIFAVKALQNI